MPCAFFCLNYGNSIISTFMSVIEDFFIVYGNSESHSVITQGLILVFLKT